MSSAGQVIGGVVGAVVGFFTPIGPVYSATIAMETGDKLELPQTDGRNVERIVDQTIDRGGIR